MKILVLNAGSSSIKFQLFDMDENKSIASGIIEQIGDKNSCSKIEFDGEKIEKIEPIKNHNIGLKIMNQLLIESNTLVSLSELGGIGHRIVQGGGTFSKPVIVDEFVASEIERLIPLAPLHNRAHLNGIEAMLEQVPDVKQVAVFDTAFHATIPEYAYMYALPYKYYKEVEQEVRVAGADIDHE